jgi:membrane protease YdiL (CAAX protease family)
MGKANRNEPSVRVTAVVLAVWVGLVLGQEAWATLDPAMRIPWLVVSQSVGADLELFPWLTWGLLPALFAYRRHGRWLDARWFGVARWTPGDWRGLGVVAVIAAISLLVIPLVPSLQENYRTLASQGPVGDAEKARYFAQTLLWVLTWLPLWELMTRGMLLPFLDRAFPRHGWLVVPALETTFHLVKPWPEAVGMLAFSLVATRWVRARRNLLLPFLAHLAFEIAVFGYVAFAGP